MQQAVTHSFYDGVLVYNREHNSFYWIDGTPEPRIRAVPRYVLAPRFRCLTLPTGTFIEIPERWEDRFEWSGDSGIRQCILDLVRQRGRLHRVYVEGAAELEDDRRPLVDGWIIPLELWEDMMREPCDIIFDPSQQLSIMRTVRRLQESHPSPASTTLTSLRLSNQP